MNNKSFIKSTSIYGALPAINKFAAVFLIPIYTRIFSQTDYGVVEYFYTIIPFIAVLIDLQIYSGVGRYYYEVSKSEQKKIISTGFWQIVIIASVICSTILWKSSLMSLIFFGVEKYSSEFRLGSLWLFLFVLRTYVSVLMRFEGKPLIYLVVSVLSLALRIAVSIILVVFVKKGISGIILGQITADFIQVIIFSILLRKKIGIIYEKKWIIKLYSYSLPLLPAVLLYYFNSNLIKRMIILFLDSNYLGIFSIAFKISTFVLIIEFAIRMSWEPFLFSNFHDNSFRKRFRYIYLTLLKFVSIISAILILFSQEVIDLLVDDKFFSAYRYAGIFIVFNMLKLFNSIAGSGLKTTNNNKYISLAVSGGFLFTFTIILFLRGNYGLYSFAYAMLFGNFFTLITISYFTKIKSNLDIPIIKTLLVLVGLLLLNIIVTNYSVSLILKFAISIMLVVKMFYTNKNQILFGMKNDL